MLAYMQALQPHLYHKTSPVRSGVLVIPFPLPSSINLPMHNERFLVTVVVIHRRDKSDC